MVTQYTFCIIMCDRLSWISESQGKFWCYSSPQIWCCWTTHTRPVALLPIDGVCIQVPGDSPRQGFRPQGPLITISLLVTHAVVSLAFPHHFQPLVLNSRACVFRNEQYSVIS